MTYLNYLMWRAVLMGIHHLVLYGPRISTSTELSEEDRSRSSACDLLFNAVCGLDNKNPSHCKKTYGS